MSTIDQDLARIWQILDKLRTQESPNPAWIDFTPTWTNYTRGNGVINEARYQIYGKKVFFHVRETLGTTSVMGAGPYMDFPVASAAPIYGYAGVCQLADSGVANYLGILLYASGRVYLNLLGAGGTYVTVSGIGATTPFAWGSGDMMNFHGWYELG